MPPRRRIAFRCRKPPPWIYSTIVSPLPAFRTVSQGMPPYASLPTVTPFGGRGGRREAFCARSFAVSSMTGIRRNIKFKRCANALAIRVLLPQIFHLRSPCRPYLSMTDFSLCSMFLLLCRCELRLHLLIDEFACGLFFLPGGFVARLTGGFALLHPFDPFGRHG